MIKKISAIIFILCILALPVCAKKRQAEEIITPMTQLQKRTYQTRVYPQYNKVMIMKSVLNVLQDEGYIVYNVNSLLGFVYAVKDFDTSDKNIDISKEFGFSKSRLNYNGVKVATIESCINITEYNNIVRTRVNFERKLLNEYGNAQFIDDVKEEEFYQNFYEKVDHELELQKQIIVAPTPTITKDASSQKVKKHSKQNTKTESEIKTENKTEIENSTDADNIKNSKDIEPADNETIKKDEVIINNKESAKEEPQKTDKKEKQSDSTNETKNEPQTITPENKDENTEDEQKLTKKQIKEQKREEKEHLKEMKKLEKQQAKEAEEYEKLKAKEEKENKD